MIKISAFKVNVMYIKIFLGILLISMLFLLVHQSFLLIQSYNVISRFDTNTLKKAIENTSLLKEYQGNTENNVRMKEKLMLFVSKIHGFDIKSPETVMKLQIPALVNYDNMHSVFETSENNLDFDETHNEKFTEQIIKNENEKEDKQEKEKEEPEIKPKESFLRAGNVTLINETDYQIDLKGILDSKLKIAQNPKKPQILIYHTHTCEAYTPSKKYNFTHTDTDRTGDNRYNMVRVGEELAQTLKKQYGYNVIHDETIYDGESYNKAYTKSLKTVEAYVKKYPSISLIIDLHRDGMNINGKKLRVATKIGKNYASNLMIVVGSDARGLSHPNWRENLRLGVKLANKLNSMYPGIGRGVNLKEGRFNQFLSKNSILLEVGGNGNTLDEALESTKYLSQAINEVLKEAK